ncbi:MAG: hypothetical protein EXS35_08070 [Pedosphaera sp.]|nr:hypothetical protein [Pedosphaera sp.]
MTSHPADSSPLNFLDSPDLRRWFARWLIATWQWRCKDSLTPLSPKDFNHAFDRMEAAVERLAKGLANLRPAAQFIAFQKAARKCGLEAPLESTLADLKFLLTHTPPTPPEKPCREKSDTAQEWRSKLRNWKRAVREWPLRRKAYEASPRFAERAQLARMVEKFGFELCAKRYPGDPGSQFALRAVISNFSAQNHIFPPGPDGRLVWTKGLLEEVKKCCQQPGGSRILAKFIVTFLRYGPDAVAGESDRLPAFLHALRCNGDLSKPLERLASDAKLRKRKGWQRLEATLTLALNYITKRPKKLERLRDFELDHALDLSRATSRERRKALGLDSNTDHRIRPLSRKEHLILAEQFHSDIKRDGSGESSAESLMTRARRYARQKIRSS